MIDRSHRTLSKVALLLLAFLLPAFAADEPGRELANPSPIDMYFLQHFVANTEPPFPELAKLDFEYQHADEFNRDSTLARLEGDLRKRAETVKDVKFLQVSLYCNFSEYDSKYKEFDFDLDDSSAIPYQAFNRQVRLALTNGNLAQSWKLEPSEAQNVMQRTGGERFVALNMKLEIIDAPPGVNGAPLVINARILEYDIRTRRNLFLGHVVVK